jgi:hypothetical protein
MVFNIKQKKYIYFVYYSGTAFSGSFNHLFHPEVFINSILISMSKFLVSDNFFYLKYIHFL